MQLTEHSKCRLMQTFAHWQVPRDYADPMYNYLVYGYAPGSCFTSILANDFHGAIQRSHPANTVESLKSLSGWITDTVPKRAFGSYAAVDEWIRLDANDRRVILENHRLVFTSKEETWKILNGERAVEPFL